MLPNEKPIPIILVANKCDLEGVTIDSEKLDRFCSEEGFKKWFATSAQNNISIG